MRTPIFKCPICGNTDKFEHKYENICIITGTGLELQPKSITKEMKCTNCGVISDNIKFFSNKDFNKIEEDV